VTPEPIKPIAAPTEGKKSIIMTKLEGKVGVIA